ncbi:MAG: L,D-transpeptidase family protein [Acidobacteria bacterium]|nr:L,D-transpeptidase family protein [Acidobacteriota bacterium]
MKAIAIFPRLAVMIASLCIASAGAAQVQPLEPVALPPAVEQGVDMAYIDPEIAGDIRWRNTKLDDVTFARYAGAPLDLIQAINPMYTDLRRGLVQYQKEWGSLPQFGIASGPTLRLGSKGARVTLLRERLGLPTGSQFDNALAKRVAAYQQVHGLGSDGTAGEVVISSLNRGSEHYEHVLMINMERARRLPAPGEVKRHIVVDAGSATVSMYENGVLVDSMRAVVGTNESQTPMMAALIRYANVHPYWNVPPSLNVKMVAPRVLEQGLGYLSERNYEVFANWSGNAPQLNPANVDWQAVKDGKLALRIGRRPGPGNSMGDIKFMMPNALGIYLHDTPDKTVFKKDERWISNGCVRLEDAHRLAAWLFGAMPKGGDPRVEERVELREPVPVLVTYLTVAAKGDDVVFREDRYERDAAVLARYFREEMTLVASGQK